MYLQYYAIAFFVFAIIDKKNMQTWFLLVCSCCLLKLNIAFFDTNTDARYIIRTSIMFVFALFVLHKMSSFALYQASVLGLFLISNLLMLRQVANDNFFYANYEVITYALVCAQLAGIVPRIWCYTCNSFTNYISSDKNSKLDSRV